MTFCKFNYDGAYEFNLTCTSDQCGGGNWELMRDGNYYMGCFICYDGIRTLTGNSKGKLHPLLETYMISRIIDSEDAKEQAKKPRWAR